MHTIDNATTLHLSSNQEICVIIIATMLHRIPPHKVSIILVFRDHPSNIKCEVKSNTAYETRPSPPPYMIESRTKCCFCIFGNTNAINPIARAAYTTAIE